MDCVCVKIFLDNSAIDNSKEDIQKEKKYCRYLLHKNYKENDKKYNNGN